MDALSTTRTTGAVAAAHRTLDAPDRVDLDSLAHSVAADGIAAHTPRVLGVVLEARELGVDDGLVSLLADDLASEVSRLRAFGLVASAVEAARSLPRHPAEILSA